MINKLERNEKLAADLQEFIIKYNLEHMTRIYFNNKAIQDGKDIIEDIKPSNYFEYANNETVSMSYEGDLYHILNTGSSNSLEEKFNKIFKKHDCYYEFGDDWNLTVCFNREWY